MQQWEYLNVMGNNEIVFADASKQISVQAYLTQMGRSGWELVAVTPHDTDVSGDPCYTYRLKRPIQRAESPPPPEPAPRKVTRTPALPADDDEQGGFAFGMGHITRG